MTATRPVSGRSRPLAGGRIAYVVTHPMTAEFLLRGQLEALVREGFEVHVLVGRGEAPPTPNGATSTLEIRNLGREIRILRDLLALVEIFRALRRLDPHVVNASTPKAGLLGMVASLLARVPHRIYTLRGLRFETAHGAKKVLLAVVERIAAACAHRVVAVSDSLRGRAIEAGLVSAAKITVLGSGSSNGVDTSRFHGRRSPADLELGRALGLSGQAPVVGFLGRLTHDKGVGDLVSAFTEQVLSRVPDARLLVVGGYEEGDPVEVAMRRELEQNPAVVQTGFVQDSAPYYRLMDVLAFPSYREGFPNAPLEAAASGIPVAAYAATGTVDAVADGVTGTLVPVGASAALGDAICSYLLDEELRHKHGAAGRARVVDSFRSELIWNHWRDLYLRELQP